IQEAVIGASLLETQIKRLVGASALEAQPFSTAFFATTVNLRSEWLTVLGSDLERQQVSYDFHKAALASSAFPGVFATRRESEIFPGRGRSDIYFGDGGTFDNLPFIPAIDVLSI